VVRGGYRPLEESPDRDHRRDEDHYRERDGAALFKTRHDGGGLLAFNAAFLISGRRYWRACPSGDLPNRWRDPRRFETIPFKVVLISRRQE
jgi:hypothetical protein